MAETPDFQLNSADGRLSLMHTSEFDEAADNPREITDERFAALKYAMEADPGMLEARPIIVDARKGDVVCGNMRLRAARSLGWEQVPVYLKEFTSDSQRREWMLRDNQEYGNWVPDELSKLVTMHESEGGDMRLLGFGDQELADLRKIEEGGGFDLPEEGDADTDDLTTVWGIVIDCEGEDQQQELLEELNERGVKCRALMV